VLTLIPAEIGNGKTANYLQAAIGPRPICFASTINAAGEVNLSPFSFFNIFSSNPATLVFSPSLSGRTGLKKHTLLNIEEVPEVSINVVTFDMVHQVSLASTDYPHGINEFAKAGFTETPSEAIKPPRVAESPVQMECIVKEVVSLGEQGGAGQLVIAEVIRVHIADEILTETQRIDPLKLDLVARLGDNWYTRGIPGMFEVIKPIGVMGMGVDALPKEIRESKVLTGNDLAQLASLEHFPDEEALVEVAGMGDVSEAIQNGTEAQHHLAQKWIAEGQAAKAFALLMQS